jgi:DNA polymerase delta subunit 1
MDPYHIRVADIPIGADLTKLEFMITNVIVSDTPPVEIPYDARAACSTGFASSLPRINKSFVQPAATVLIHATAACGATTCVRVHGFQPHLTYRYTSNNQRDQLIDELQTELRIPKLTATLITAHRMWGWVPSPSDPSQPELCKFVRVSFPSAQSRRRAIFMGTTKGCVPCEAKADVTSMFFDLTSLVPSSWFRFKAAPRRHALSKRFSHAQLECEVNIKVLQPVARDDIAPILIASVDIECFSSTGGFPCASNANDRVAIIGTAFWRVGTPIETTKVVVQCVGACGPVDGAHPETYQTEAQLLDAWRDLIVVHSQAEIVTGYNTFGFDYKYMCARAAATTRFFYNDQVIVQRNEPLVKELESNALGQNSMHLLGWGRVDIDLYTYIKAQHKLVMYKLDFVAEHFLGDHKVDLPYAELFTCMATGASPADMARAAFYCAEDCRIPLRLMKRLAVVPDFIEMSRVTFTTIPQLVTRGQQIKVFNQIIRHAHRHGYVVNDSPAADPDAEGYEGAIVIEPTPGFYNRPVATLDFASLYPSIMLAHNLCHSTFVADPAHLGIPGVTYETHDVGNDKSYTFVTSTPGVLPAILRDLLAARKRAKTSMAATTDPDAKAIYNSRQLALKVSCNSVYGFTGAVKRGMYPCIGIAESVTFCGRKLIQKTAALAVDAFKPVVARVIYGDTDSVFVLLDDPDMTAAEAFMHGERVAQFISDQFAQDITLEMEKVYKPLLLITKKRYIGLMHEPDRTGTVKFSKMDYKGIELVRRDNCKLVKDIYYGVVNPMLHEMDPAKSVSNLRTGISRLVADLVPTSEFIITKELRKRESYVNPCQSQLIVADKITTRSGGAVVPQVGDRLPFVIIADKGLHKVNDRAEDPAYVTSHPEVKIDRIYYLLQKVHNPIQTLFLPFDELRREVTQIFEDARIQISLQVDRQMTMAACIGEDAPPAAADAFAIPLPTGARMRCVPKRARKA